MEEAGLMTYILMCNYVALNLYSLIFNFIQVTFIEIFQSFFC